MKGCYDKWVWELLVVIGICMIWVGVVVVRGVCDVGWCCLWVVGSDIGYFFFF